MKHFTFLTVFCLLSYYSLGQSCCSGGVPLSGNIGLPAGEVGSWQLSLTYDINTLRTLKSGSEKLNDQLRERKTRSILLETGYTFSSKWSADLFLSYINQERHIFTFSGTQSTATNGLGDAVILIKYRLTPESIATIWLIGAGPKIPLGSTDKTNDSGISLSADLQPGSGSWDGVFWSSLTRTLPFKKSFTLSVTSILKINGNNNDYLGTIKYKFGNESQLLIGLADRVAIGRIIVDPSLTLQYRQAGRDLNNGQKIEATGGRWLFFNPGISISANRSLSLNFIASLPIYSFVNNTQLTPTHRFTTGLFFKI